MLVVDAGKTNGVFNWAFGPTKQLAIVNCTIDRAGRDSLDIAGASEQVTLAVSEVTKYSIASLRRNAFSADDQAEIPPSCTLLLHHRA